MPLSNDWMTLILMSLFVVFFLLSLMDVTRFQEIVSKLFKISFLEQQLVETFSIFSGFHLLFTLLSITVFSFFFFEVKVYYYGANSQNFQEFFNVFRLFFIYFFLKSFIENALIYLFMLQRGLAYFVVSEANYFFAISSYLFILILLKEYTNFNSTLLYYVAGFLFGISFIFHLISNKNLILNHLFYFILYICAFEIAPLLILFKLMF